MKQTMRHLTLGLALFMASFASLGLAQSTPQQVKGINSQGAKWQALTDRGQVAVATNATTEYVAWKVNGSQNIEYSTSTDGVTWATPLVVKGTYQRRAWKAQTTGVPAITVDNNTGYVWMAWTDPTTSDLFYSTYNGVAWARPQAVSGQGWTAQNFLSGASPALGGGNGITMTWIGPLNDDIYYSNWTYPGWSVPQVVSNGTWTADPVPSGFSTPDLTVSLSGGSAMYWVDYYGDIFGAAFIFGGWAGDNAIGCDSWTAQTWDDNPPAAANFTLNGGANAMLFWVNTAGDGYQLAYTYETFDQNGCPWADPATVTIATGNSDIYVGPAVSVGPKLSILAWPQLVGRSETKSSVWYLNPLTLPGLH